MITYVLFALGFVFLIKGADLLVSGASAIAKRFGISDLVIGLTVVAFGTSTPELFVNLLASARGNTDIAMGNVLGSNISNVFLILGVAAMIHPLSVPKGTVWREIPFGLLAALVLAWLANDLLIDGQGPSALTRIDGLVLLAFFAVFLYYTFSIAKPIAGMDAEVPDRPLPLVRAIVLVGVGLAGLTVGGQWIVAGAVKIATALGMSESLVGLTIVAVGTSLPELATSAVAAWRGNVEIAVGNVVGSNIFNLFMVLGVSSTVRPLPTPAGSNRDMAVVLLSSVLLFLFMFTGKRRTVDRWEGAVFVLIYAGYIAWVVLSA